MNTPTSGRTLELVEPLHRRAVDPAVLRLARLEPDLEPVRAVVILEVERDPRHALPEAHELALVGGPARMAGAAEVERLEQVALAGAVRPADHGEALAEGHLGPLVVAEVAQAGARDAHPPAYTLSRIGITR